MFSEIISIDALKILSAVFMFVGTVLVSWRVTDILKAHSFAIETLDLNEQVRQARKKGYDVPNIQTYGMSTRVVKAEKFGRKLLVAGFIMQVIGVACNVAAIIL